MSTSFGGMIPIGTRTGFGSPPREWQRFSTLQLGEDGAEPIATLPNRIESWDITNLAIILAK
jgi:hypothetical protein